MFVPNFKILDAVVPEKSLTEKNYRHTQTDIVMEKTTIALHVGQYTPIHHLITWMKF